MFTYCWLIIYFNSSFFVLMIDLSFGTQLERLLSVFNAFLLNPFMFLLGDMGLLNILFLLSILVEWKNFMRFLMSRSMLVFISFVCSVYSIGVTPNIFIRCSVSIGQSSVSIGQSSNMCSVVSSGRYLSSRESSSMSLHRSHFGLIVSPWE